MGRRGKGQERGRQWRNYGYLDYYQSVLWGLHFTAKRKLETEKERSQEVVENTRQKQRRIVEISTFLGSRNWQDIEI